MGVQYLELRSMIDGALGHPEKGIVNLNMLHSLLHEILNHLDFNRTTKESINSEIKDAQKEQTAYKSETKLSNQLLSELDGGLTTRDDFGAQKSPQIFQSHTNEQLKLKEFEDRLSSIETKLKALNNLPPEKSFLAQTTQSDDSQTAQTDKENTLAMMWKYMTMYRRVQATEEAVEKVMNILNDVMDDVEQLKTVKSHLDKLQQEQLKMAGELNAVKWGSNGGSDFNLEKFDSLGVVALKKDLAPFVTWNALEQALNNRETESKRGAQHMTADRPDTAPPPSSPREVIVDQEPPKTAMNPKEFTKLTGKNPDDMKTIMANEETKDSLFPKENSLSEIPLDHDSISNVISREDTKDSITQPSPEFLNKLNRIGELPKQYDDVAVQVSMMSELQTKLASDVHKVEVDILPRKVDKEDLQLPENLVEQIDMLKQGLDMLNTNQDLQMLATIKETSIQNKEKIDSLKAEIAMFSQHLKRLDHLKEAKEPEAIVPSYDQEVLNSVRDKLNNVEQEQEKIVLKSKEEMNKILENLDEKQRVIDELFQYTERLQERKADRENVATEMDIKADKHALDGKVNQSTFDETFQMFDRGLQDALQKMEDYMNEEMSLKDTLSRISREMEGKIDTDSLQLMKDYFEKQIKDVQESRDKFARETRVDATDAAGVRRKLPIHYHCISCNRPVELPVRDSEPALPEHESLPYRRIKFPFASYDVEQLGALYNPGASPKTRGARSKSLVFDIVKSSQIKLRQKSMKSGYNADESAAVRDLVTGRPCGGSHTVINSQLRKSTKFHQFNQTTAVRDDTRFAPKVVREISVLDFLRGSDGHYYKGRSRQLLPAIPRRTKYPNNANVSIDSDSYKGNGRLQEEASHTTDQEKAGSHYLLRTPSPPVQDNLSSSYPERTNSKSPHIQGQHYSSDDLNIPSNTALNRESLKIFRRKRGQDKELKGQRCWDNPSTKGGTQDQRGYSNESSSPKSMKRTTPVGEEQPYITSPEGSPQKHGIHNNTTEDKSKISSGGYKDQDDHL